MTYEQKQKVEMELEKLRNDYKFDHIDSIVKVLRLIGYDCYTRENGKIYLMSIEEHDLKESIKESLKKEYGFTVKDISDIVIQSDLTNERVNFAINAIEYTYYKGKVDRR